LWQKADHHLLLQQKDRVRMVTSSRLLEHRESIHLPRIAPVVPPDWFYARIIFFNQPNLLAPFVSV